MDEPDYEQLMNDASHCKVHPHTAGAKGLKSEVEPHNRGLNTKIHLAVDAHGISVRGTITEGTKADCKEVLSNVVDEKRTKSFIH